jgi:hypothetical protein
VRGIARDLATAQGCEQLVKALSAVDILVNNRVRSANPIFTGRI